MIRFIHTADIHFGIENYGKLDPKTGIHSRLYDFDRAFGYCVDYAVHHNVDFFLLAGDAYKTAQPSPTQQKLLFKSLLKLFRAQIPVIMIVGNHDNSYSFGKAHALEVFGQLPIDGFYVIEKPTTLNLNTRNGPLQIVGIPWPSRASITLQAISSQQSDISTAISQAVNTQIQEFAKSLNPSQPALLAGHLTICTGIFSGSEKRAIYGSDPLFLPSQLAITPFDYVALGHLHRYQNLNPQGYPALVYSGSIERVDFGERNEEKGFCDVRIHAKGRTDHTFIPVPTRRFIQVEITINPSRSHTEQIIEQLRTFDIADAIVKIVYHLPLNSKDKVDTVAIQNACASAHHIVGIFPVRPTEARTQRSQVSANMNLEQLLRSYFATKPEWHDKVEQLLIRAHELEKTLNQQEGVTIR